MAEAGADILIAHMGLTTKGTIGGKTTLTLEECVEKIKAIIKAGKEVNPDIMVFCHGGPILEAEDVNYIIEKVENIDGFLITSYLDKIQTAKAIKDEVSSFKSIIKK